MKTSLTLNNSLPYSWKRTSPSQRPSSILTSFSVNLGPSYLEKITIIELQTSSTLSPPGVRQNSSINQCVTEKRQGVYVYKTRVFSEYKDQTDQYTSINLMALCDDFEFPFPGTLWGSVTCASVGSSPSLSDK